MSNNAAGDTSTADRAGAPLNWRAGGAVDGTALRFAPGGGGGVPGTGSLVDGDRGVQGDDDKSTAKRPVRGSHASGELPSAAVGAPGAGAGVAGKGGRGGEGGSRTVVVGGSLSLLGGYGSDDSD